MSSSAIVTVVKLMESLPEGIQEQVAAHLVQALRGAKITRSQHSEVKKKSPSKSKALSQTQTLVNSMPH
jgi:hypothetical protein